MKNTIKKYSSTHQRQFLAALVLTGILSVSSGLTVITTATAAPTDTVAPTAVTKLKQNVRNGLPRPVANAVRRDLSRRTNILPARLEIIDYSEETWRNGCLELPQPGEVCTQALVSGWRVVVSDGKREWTYHTNRNGRTLRLNTANNSDNNQVPNLPSSVVNAVRREASRRFGVTTSQVRIIEAQRRTWNDGCLELGGANELCTQALVPGWRLVVAVENQRLIYHTNASGSITRLNERDGQTDDNNSRRRLINAVLQFASRETGLSLSELRVVRAEEVTTDGCLGLARPGEACTRIALNALQVTVAAGEQRLVYRIHPNGREIRLNEAASKFTLPPRVRDAVLQEAAQISGLPRRSLNIVSFKRQQWAEDCGPDIPLPLCDQVLIQGWEVTVGAGNRRWVFLSDNTGSRIKLSADDDQTNNANLPERIAEQILRVTSRQFGVPLSQLQIVDVQRREWPDGCLGLGGDGIGCTQATVPGWEVTVSDDNQRWVYRVGETGVFKLDEEASEVGNTGTRPVSIPASQLPPPLTRGMVYRVISSGGFAGRTFETVLMNDGRLMQMRLGDANDSERRVWSVSPQQLRQFQRLLEGNRTTFNNVDYPPTPGSADFITYTHTSSFGTVQYNDTSRQNLPRNLQAVVDAWNQMVRQVR